MEGGGEKGKEEVSFSPLPLPRNFFVLLSSPLSRRTGAETLATGRLVTQSARSRRSYGKIGDCEPSIATTTTT